MNNKIPDEDKKVKISISIDPFLDKKIAEMAIDKKFYKKSRLIEYILKKYIDGIYITNYILDKEIIILNGVKY